MPRLNSDVVELVLEELKEINGVTTTFATTCSETALALRREPEKWKSPFNFFALPKKAQQRVVFESMSTCLDWQFKMFHCVSTKFCYDENCHWLWWIEQYLNKHDTPYSPPSRSGSEGSEDSYAWIPISRSGSSSSGSADEDLLEKWKTGAGKAM